MVLHANAREHFDKLTRVRDRLNNEVHKDDLDDFFKTAYHLIENTEKDPSATAAQKAAAKALRNDPDIQLCREITNREKHFTLDPRSHPNPKIVGATTNQGYGVGRFGRGGFGAGEQDVELNLNDGTKWNAHDLVEVIYKKFTPIF